MNLSGDRSYRELKLKIFINETDGEKIGFLKNISRNHLTRGKLENCVRETLKEESIDDIDNFRMLDNEMLIINDRYLECCDMRAKDILTINVRKLKKRKQQVEDEPEMDNSKKKKSSK